MYDTKTVINATANLCLERAEVYEPFDGEDMSNAMLIFQHVFMSLLWQRCQELNLTLEQRGELAEECGKNMRQTILMATGIDLHEVVSKGHWPETIV